MNFETSANKNQLQGIIFNSQRYSLHDGPGIRTLVFMKGCPLSCLWCSNPESQSFTFEVGFAKGTCIACGRCYEACSYHAIDHTTYSIDRSLCQSCFKCSTVCPTGAKSLIGEKVSIDTLADLVEQDRLFYDNSGGGVTMGGGEPCCQSGFVFTFLAECKRRHISTAVETCGFVPWNDLHKAVYHADLVFFDLKHMDNEKHLQFTGVGNELILSNLKKLGASKNIVMRIPVIPGLNDDLKNLQASADFAGNVPGISRIELLPYHNFGQSKYELLNRPYTLDHVKPLSQEQKKSLVVKAASIRSNKNIIVL